MRIAKAHGLGNAFLLVEATAAPQTPGPWARQLCDPETGLGGDGVLLVGQNDAGPTMRLINADGSEAEISGNGLRCVAASVFARGLMPARHAIATAVGPRVVEVESLGANRFRVQADLGRPILASDEIPMAIQPPRSPVVDHPIEVDTQKLRVTVTSLGNPHCTVFLDSLADDDLVRSLGPALESHALFPRRTNVEFVTVLGRDLLRVRFWERGAGFTRSSGTGAAGATVAAILTGRADRRLRVICDGGILEVEWPVDGSVRQAGEVEILFEGEWLPVETVAPRL